MLSLDSKYQGMWNFNKRLIAFKNVKSREKKSEDKRIMEMSTNFMKSIITSVKMLKKMKISSMRMKRKNLTRNSLNW